jgi:hypothetical protein
MRHQLPEMIALAERMIASEILASANGRDARPSCTKIPIDNAISQRRVCDV